MKAALVHSVAGRDFPVACAIGHFSCGSTKITNSLCRNHRGQEWEKKSDAMSREVSNDHRHEGRDAKVKQEKLHSPILK